MIPRRLDFKTLKETLSIERVLVARGAAEHLRRCGHRLVGPCPIHHGDNPDAFVVDLDKKVWHCFTHCDGGGDIVDLVRCLDRVGYREAAEILADIAERPAPAPPATTHPPRLLHSFHPYTRRLALDPDDPFLRAKGIHSHTARTFETGAWYGPGFLEGCIGVRLHDPSGNPLGYMGRRLQPNQGQHSGKWKIPRHFPKHQVLFNAHRVRHALKGGTVVVVECPWGVQRLHQLGLPAVALLGTRLFDAHRVLLAHASRLVLLLDADPAGREATATIRSVFPRSASIALPEGKDPDEVDDAQLQALLAPSFLF